MTLAEILASLFPQGHAVAVRDGLVSGTGPFAGGRMHVVGVDGDTPLGTDGALVLSRAVLDAAAAAPAGASLWTAYAWLLLVRDPIKRFVSYAAKTRGLDRRRGASIDARPDMPPPSSHTPRARRSASSGRRDRTGTRTTRAPSASASSRTRWWASTACPTAASRTSA